MSKEKPIFQFNSVQQSQKINDIQSQQSIFEKKQKLDKIGLENISTISNNQSFFSTNISDKFITYDQFIQYQENFKQTFQKIIFDQLEVQLNNHYDQISDQMEQAFYSQDKYENLLEQIQNLRLETDNLKEEVKFLIRLISSKKQLKSLTKQCRFIHKILIKQALSSHQINKMTSIQITFNPKLKIFNKKLICSCLNKYNKYRCRYLNRDRQQKMRFMKKTIFQRKKQWIKQMSLKNLQIQIILIIIITFLRKLTKQINFQKILAFNFNLQTKMQYFYSKVNKLKQNTTYNQKQQIVDFFQDSDNFNQWQNKSYPCREQDVVINEKPQSLDERLNEIPLDENLKQSLFIKKFSLTSEDIFKDFEMVLSHKRESNNINEQQIDFLKQNSEDVIEEQEEYSIDNMKQSQLSRSIKHEKIKEQLNEELNQNQDNNSDQEEVQLYLDNNGYLLDQNGKLVIGDDGNTIQLSKEHILYLKTNNILEE